MLVYCCQSGVVLRTNKPMLGVEFGLMWYAACTELMFRAMFSSGLVKLGKESQSDNPSKPCGNEKQPILSSDCEQI